jgi:hypothetical protein
MAESFDITEPLTKRLRGLLREYPPGPTVLRELLQNADDAGARLIVKTPSHPPKLLSAGVVNMWVVVRARHKHSSHRGIIRPLTSNTPRPRLARLQ